MERGTGKMNSAIETVEQARQSFDRILDNQKYAGKVITQMKFPFAQKAEYIEIYNRIAQHDRMLYDIAVKDDIVWIQHIDVGNTVFVRQ